MNSKHPEGNHAVQNPLGEQLDFFLFLFLSFFLSPFLYLFEKICTVRGRERKLSIIQVRI
jgi:hypothetical protein